MIRKREMRSLLMRDGRSLRSERIRRAIDLDGDGRSLFHFRRSLIRKKKAISIFMCGGRSLI
ncbi:MAG: hypothetical protein HC789_08715 [Microcoleus sp. CSU_2_2]|nr:hypothetical protein [Microcoleus sp. SU_5_3]NJS10446.1 hypothetical protein [Microcoleus sp. CSU_2_2]